MKILGVDIGGGTYATAYFLEEIPVNPREFSQSAEFVEFQISYSNEDLAAALELKPDCVVLEPTGGYEDIVLHWCERTKTPYRLANVGRLAAFRRDMGLPKADRYDAFALACFGIAKWDDRSAWVHPIVLRDLREMLLQRRTLQGQKRSLINQFRQRLHKECPEVQQFDQRRNWGAAIPGIYRWCEGIDFKHQRSFEKKIHSTCGVGISPFTKDMGKQLYWLEWRSIELETKIDRYIAAEEFKPYTETMERFGFSSQLMAWWLCRIYPFEQWLGEDGKPIEIKRLSKVRKKPVTIRQSLGRFKCILGAGTVPNTSGVRGEVKTYRKQKHREAEYFIAGDRFCRQAFILWAEKQVVMGKNQAELMPRLMEFYQKKKGEGKPYYKNLSNLHGYTAALLFKELCKRLVTSD